MKNGWMHAEMMKEWVWKIWDSDEDEVSSLLILNCAPIHKSPKTALVLKNVNTNLLLIPPDCISLLQSAGIIWN